MAGQFEQSRRFLEHSPRPKLRKRAEPKPGAPKGPASVLWVTEDRERGLALVRGLNVQRVLELACALDGARWSPSGKGYVVSADQLPDIAAMAQYTNTPYKVKTLGGNPA